MPRGLPAFHRAVEAAAACLTSSTLLSVKAVACGPRWATSRRMMGSSASTMSLGVSAPVLYALCMSSTVWKRGCPLFGGARSRRVMSVGLSGASSPGCTMGITVGSRRGSTPSISLQRRSVPNPALLHSTYETRGTAATLKLLVLLRPSARIRLQVAQIVEDSALDHRVVCGWRCAVWVLESLGDGVVEEASVAVGNRHLDRVAARNRRL
jgi:hypothetical protein